MNHKLILFGALGLFLAIMLISSALAITASIGNGIMVLRANVGDKLDKSVLVQNRNNVSVSIELSASGELEKYVTIKDSKFILAPGEEKKAAFTIIAAKNGTTKTQINVKFTAVGEKKGAGLSSTIILIASGNAEDYSESQITGQAANENSAGSKQINYVTVALSITGIIFLILVILLVIAYRKTKKDAEKTEATKPKKSLKKDA